MFIEKVKIIWMLLLVFMLSWFGYFHDFESFIKPLHSRKQICKIPNFPPWDAEILKAVQPVTLPLVCNRSKPDLTFLTLDGTLKFHHHHMSHYLVDCHPNNCKFSLKCSYKCVNRVDGDQEISFDPPVSILLQSKTKIDCEFVQVDCFINGVARYAQVHSQIITNIKRLKELDGLLPVNARKKYHNVILFIIDATSRLNFERFCPKTLKVLENRYKAVNFKGLTRHTGESWDNAIAFFGGKSYKNYSHEVKYHQYFDNWSLIWKNYSQNGYLTLDDEDSTSNIFLFNKRGFFKQPTDHRYRVFWLAAKRLYGYGRDEFQDPCQRNEAKHQMQLEYLNRFLTAYEESRPKFVFFWNTALNHNINEQLAYLDDDFVSFLDTNYHLLKNSFLFIMGDHGQKLGKLRKTNVGRFETQMPVLIVSVPQNLRHKHPQILRNMKINSNILVSHYDTFVTLHDILASQMQGWDGLDAQKSWSHLQVDVAKPQSYLRPLDPYRECQEVGVPPDRCICMQQMHYIERERDYPIATKLVTTVIDQLNKVVSVEKKCAQMKIFQVLKLDELTSVSSYIKYKDKKRTFRILIEVKPSNGTFEGIVRFDEDDDSFVTDGQIKRTNRYGSQSHCIVKTIPNIRQFCYCREQI